MKFLIVFIILIGFLTTPVSANNVTLEIFQNMDGIYYVCIDDGDLIECGDSCSVNIDNVTGEATSITDADIKRIGKQVAVEMYGAEDIFNESIYYGKMSDIVSGKFKDQQEWISVTWMPQKANLTELELLVSQKQSEINELNAKYQGHDATMSAKNAEIDTLKRETTAYFFGIMFLLIAIAVMVIGKSRSVREFKESRKQ